MDTARLNPSLAQPASRLPDPPRPRTILLVDDDPMILYVLTEILMERGYSVFPCNSGEMALQTFKNHSRIDLLITDFQMAGINGIQLATALARKQPDLPVIVISASIMRSPVTVNLTRNLNQTRWYFFDKPVDLALFLNTVSDLTRDNRVGLPRGQAC